MGKIIRKCIEYGGSSNSAENIKYDDTKNVKQAIDEVKSELAGVNSEIAGVNSNLENKVQFIDYGNMITVSTNPYTVTEDVYVQYIHLSSSSSVPFLVDNVTVSVSDTTSSPKMFVDTFNGFVKKGSVLSCSVMINNVNCKIFKLS